MILSAANDLLRELFYNDYCYNTVYKRQPSATPRDLTKVKITSI